MFTASMVHAQTCSQRIAQPSYGIGIDMNGNVWVPEHFSGRLRQYETETGGERNARIFISPPQAGQSRGSTS